MGRVQPCGGKGSLKRLVATLAFIGVLAAGAACDNKHGSTKPPKPPSKAEQFSNNCRLSGGIPVITREKGETQYNCVHPPAN